MNKNVKWVIHDHLIQRALPTGRPNLLQALQSQGYETICLTYDETDRDLTKLPEWNGECVVTYGSVQFVNQVVKKRRGMWQPGAFLRTENLSYSAYAPYMGDILLNDDFIMLPYAEFRRRGLKAWDGSAFIRPNSVTKLFTGFVINSNDYEHETNSLERLSNVSPEDILVVARPKPILGEFRFIISDGKVITGSAYSWDNTLDVRSDVHPACLEMAQEVAQREWQPDRVYTCDIALTEINGKQEARVLEFNAFSCSGLYACDTELIANAVSYAAWNEYSGDDI